MPRRCCGGCCCRPRRRRGLPSRQHRVDRHGVRAVVVADGDQVAEGKSASASASWSRSTLTLMTSEEYGGPIPLRPCRCRRPRRPATAVVTGASSGIGADIARELAGRGHGVTLVARREDKLHELAAELGKNVRVEVIACDVADPEARANLFDEVADRGLTVDILVNNAGIGIMGAVARSTGRRRDRAGAGQRRGRHRPHHPRDSADGAPRPRRDPQRRLDGRLPTRFPARPATPEPRRSSAPTAKGCAASWPEPASPSATLCPGPVRTEFLSAAGHGRDTKFAAAFPEIPVDAVAEGAKGRCRRTRA